MDTDFPHSTKTFNDIQALLKQLRVIEEEICKADKLYDETNSGSLSTAIKNTNYTNVPENQDIMSAMCAEASYRTALATGLTVMSATVAAINKSVSHVTKMLPERAKCKPDSATVRIDWGNNMPPKEVVDALEKSLKDLSSSFSGQILARVIEIEGPNNDELGK